MNSQTGTVTTENNNENNGKKELKLDSVVSATFCPDAIRTRNAYIRLCLRDSEPKRKALHPDIYYVQR